MLRVLKWALCRVGRAAPQRNIQVSKTLSRKAYLIMPACLHWAFQYVTGFSSVFLGYSVCPML